MSLIFFLLMMESAVRDQCYDMRFESGATHLVVGPSASGKTFRTAAILDQKDKLIVDGDRIRNVVFCYSVWQPIYSTLRERGVVTKFYNKKPTCEEFAELVRDHRHEGGSIVVIDDFMGEIDTDLVNIVTVHSRHYNTSTFILFQSLFPSNRLARQISLNVKYLHVHKNPRENAQIQVLARQLYPRGYKWVVEAYHKVTEKPHSCLLMDMTQKCPDKLRIRSNYLPSEAPMKVWTSKHTAL